MAHLGPRSEVAAGYGKRGKGGRERGGGRRRERKEHIWPGILLLLVASEASLVAKTIKNLPAVQETQVQSLGQEDTLQKGMATHSSILDWRTL